MPDDFDKTTEALKAIEVADIERHRPAPQEPRTEVEQYAQALKAAQSRWTDAPAGWLR